MNDKKIIIEYLKNYYDFTTKEAEVYYKSMGEERKKIIVDGFKSNAKKTFYED